MEIAVLVFAVVLALILGAYWLFVVRAESDQQRALRRRLKKARQVVAVTAAVVKAPETVSAFSPLAAVLLSQQRLIGRLQRLVVASETAMTPGAVVLACVFLALAAGL